MAKRFTDTDKWKKEWYRELGSKLRDLRQYILDSCDHAGIWEIDMKSIKHFTGMTASIQEISSAFRDRVGQIEEDKLFIPDFIEFQYGELNPVNRAHLSVISKLNKYGIDYHNMGLISPLQGAKYKDKDKDKDKDKGVQGEIYRRIKHLTLSLEDFDKLVREGWNQEQIDSILDAIENFKQNTKYTSLLITARNWLRKDQKPNAVQKKINALDIVKQRIENEGISSHTGTD